MAPKTTSTAIPKAAEASADELAKPEDPGYAKPSPDPWTTVKGVESFADQDRLKVLLYGPNGSGKSSTLARFNCPLIGLTELQAIPAIKEANPRALIKTIQNAQDLLEFRQLCRSKNLAQKVDAVGLDSLTDIQRMLRDFYTNQQSRRKDITDQDTWGRIIDATARLARELRDIPTHTIIICLDAAVEIEGEGLIHRPAVSGKALPNQLGQFFNLVGYISRQTRPSGMRREVMFEGSDRYQIKGMTGLDAVEPPEPLYWISKRFGVPLTDSKDSNGKTVMDRIAEWRARGSMEEGTPTTSNNNTNNNTTATSTVDPFNG